MFAKKLAHMAKVKTQSRFIMVFMDSIYFTLLPCDILFSSFFARGIHARL